MTADRSGLLADYRAALELTNNLIDRTPPAKSPEIVRERAEVRLARLRRLLTELDDPHRRYPVIHVAGTSGKGSTATAAAAMLTAGGWRVGLHTSPYLQVATEKAQIDGRLIDASTFRFLVDEVLAAARDAGIAPVTYGEVWFALVALGFARAGVDIAVIEVGAGGRFDLTNVVEPAVSVITSVGLDHTETLGATIPEIAWHKAGIIKPGVPAVSAVSDPAAIEVVEREAIRAGSRLVPVRAGESFNSSPGPDGVTSWWLTDQPDEVYLPAMRGRYQAVNAATALLAIRALSEPFAALAPQAVRAGLRSARLPGRYEVMQESPTVVLDGAHNPEKVRAAMRETRSWRAEHHGARIIVVTGMLEAKDHHPMLAEITRVADELIATSPRVLAKPGADAGTLARSARELGFTGPVEAIIEPTDALAAAIARAGRSDLVLVTG
ncbi:MAG: bifunctional folylpolyglutamate synthase/dihydrofolate synthase, partial [Thermomicrobiales bacterium]|nr:bifunctional folylpolyglutamate synthase/dihydrofolate synthase [Thermomicrobiales bacterium]